MYNRTCIIGIRSFCWALSFLYYWFNFKIFFNIFKLKISSTTVTYMLKCRLCACTMGRCIYILYIYVIHYLATSIVLYFYVKLLIIDNFVWNNLFLSFLNRNWNNFIKKNYFVFKWFSVGFRESIVAFFVKYFTSWSIEILSRLSNKLSSDHHVSRKQGIEKLMVYKIFIF